MSRTIPTINTARTTLRAMRAEDFGHFAEIWANPDVVTHIGGEPRSKSVSWDVFLRNAGHWQIVGFGQWAIQIHGQREMAGQTGFFFRSRGLGEDFDAYPETGWVLEPQAQGKGLGLEAARAAHDWFDRVITGRTVCLINVDNHASLRLAEALGYSLLRDTEYLGDKVLLLTRKGPPV
jgi:RimJ/RimL family protein N-acetyltransferase